MMSDADPHAAKVSIVAAACHGHLVWSSVNCVVNAADLYSDVAGPLSRFSGRTNGVQPKKVRAVIESMIIRPSDSEQQKGEKIDWRPSFLVHNCAK